MLTSGLGLHEGLLENLVRQTVTLDVHLGSGKSLGSTRGLEVHVTQVVLVAEDVREDGILVLAGVLDETHGNAADGSCDGYTGIHQGQTACTGGSHGAGTVGLQDVRYDTDGVGIVGGNLTLQTAPCQMAVSNLTTAYAALCLGLAGGEGREVVVKQETLVFAYENVVNQFLVQFGTQRTGSQGLCLTTGEDGTSVRTGQRTCLTPDGAYLIGLTAVETDTFVQDATTHGILLHIVVVTVDETVLLLQFVSCHVGMCLSVLHLEILADSLEGLSTGMLLQGLLGHVVGGFVAGCLDLGAEFFVVDLVAVLAFHVLAQFLAEFLLQAAHGLDGLVGCLEGCEQVGLLYLLHLALYHHDVLLGGTYHEVHVSLLQLAEGGVDDELTVDAGHANLRDGTLEGDIADSQSGRGCKACQGIGHVLTIGREEDYVDIHFSVIVAGEKGTQSAVHQTASENLVVVGLTLTLRETAGETSGCEILLSVLYLQGHEICTGNGIFGGTNGGQEHRVVHAEHHGSIGLFGQFPGLDADGSSIRQLDCLCNYVHLKY